MSSFENVTTKKGLGRGLGSLLGGMEEAEEKTAPKIELQNEKSAPTKARIISTPNGATVAEKPAVVVANVETTVKTIPEESRIWHLSVEKIKPNPRQPRKEFDSEKLSELASSIKEKGILQPIVVRRTPAGFEIIAGERRWRAAQQAGLHEVPVILRKAGDADSLELALIENIQRHDLNPVDEAEAYQQLTERYGHTQEQIAKKVGKDRATVANSMRLLNLCAPVLQMLRDGALTTGHAKVLLGATDEKAQLSLAKKIVNLRLSVRAAEKLIKGNAAETDVASVNGVSEMSVSQRLVNSLSEELQKTLGTKVEIDYKKGKGKLSIHFYSDEELTSVVERLRTSWKN